MPTFSRKILLPILMAGAMLPTEAYGQTMSNLPLLEINTSTGSDPSSRSTYLDCSVSRVETDLTTDFGSSRIRLRGNSTVSLQKKPYRLKFYQKERFMGSERANAKNWVLLANHSDKTLMRNAVAFKIAELIGGMDFVPGTEFVDLKLNGKYRGNYHLTDKVDIRKKRVHITEQDTVPGPGHDISGGYLLEVDGIGYQEDIYFYTRNSLCVVVKSPDSDVISREQISYIQEFVQDVENRVTSSSFADPELGYRAVVDSLSLASWYITNELTGNPDMFWSNYMYKEKGDPHLYFGPIWDFDIAFNNCKRQGDIANYMMKDKAFHCNDHSVGIWFNRMWNDPWFQQLIWRKWNEALNSGLKEQVLDYIDALAETLNESQALNFGIYDIAKRAYDEYVLFDTYSAGVDYLKEQFSNRIDYLTIAFADLAGIKDPGSNPDPSPNPGKDPDPVEVDSIYSAPADGLYYAIFNHGVSMAVRAGDDYGVVTGNLPPEENPDFYWKIRAVDSRNYMIIHQGTEWAVTDTSNGTINTPLTLSEPDPDDRAQYWQFYELDPALHTYSIVNNATNLAWNNSSGSNLPNNKIIAWTNDSQNPQKPNRQWRFLQVDFEPDEGNGEGDGDGNGEGDAIMDPTSPNYVVTYSPSLHRLRFVAYSAEPMEGTWALYSISGAQVAAGQIAPEVTLPVLTSATYILTWQTGNHRHTMKLRI